MTVLQSFPPEICSLICQDPILERLDLNSICFISHAFRNEAQRILSSSNHFPCLRGASSVRAWCLALKRKPHLAIDIKGLTLLLPQAFPPKDIIRLTWTLYICVNLKELAMLFEDCHRRPGLIEPQYLSWNHMLALYRFKLTNFVNGCFSQAKPGNEKFTLFLRSQSKLESLELHSGRTDIFQSQISLKNLKNLDCSPQFLDITYRMTRLRLGFQNSSNDCEINVLGRVLRRNLAKDMKSLAIFLKQGQSHFPEIIRAIAASHIYIQHLEIHQFLPTQVKKDLPLPVNSYGRNIRTLVFRPPPGLPKNVGDNPNLCAYVELRTQIGRRKAAEKLIMRTLPTLTRLVLIVHEKNYEFLRNLFTGVITGEKSITWDAREWALVK